MFISFLAGFLVFSCSAPVYKKFIPQYQTHNKDKVPDYSKPEYWAAIPGRWSPCDSIPEPLRPTSVADTTADVFFLHPTTYGSPKDTLWNADINDPELNVKTDYTTILYQASAFNECRVYAPRYRQAHIRAYYSADTARAFAALDLAYQDIRNAFLYYLAHYNRGRPIIIASHSQGSTHAERLLKEFFDHKGLKRQLVVAYIIGMAIPRSYFEDLSPCADSTQTGCFVGWRTFKRGYEPDFIKKENGNSYVTNPLTWTSAEAMADKTLNQGGVLRNFNEVLPGVADAQIQGGVLWTHKPHFKGSIFYRSPNYHIGDINLYYVNIRENLRTRLHYFHLP
jgi:hypothetical protein